MRSTQMMVRVAVVGSVVGVMSTLPARAAPPEHERIGRRVALPTSPPGPRAASTVAQGGGFGASGVTLLSHVPLSEFPGGGQANDVWGYVSPAGREYAIIGLQSGTGFVDITDPTNPAIIAVIPDNSSIWSDMATFGEFAYNVNESGGGIQIINLQLIDSGIVSLVGSAAGGVSTAHNIFVNPDSGFAYACDTNFGPGFEVFNLSNPASPVHVGFWSEPQSHDVYVQSYASCPGGPRDGQPCEIVFSFAGGQGMKIVDATDKSNITTFATFTYANQAFCHQGWPSDDLRYMFFGDELDESGFGIPTTTYVVDIQDLANPHHPPGVEFFRSGLAAIDHNLMTRGKFIFEANYVNGMRVFDFSNLSSIHEVGFFDTSFFPDGVGFAGAWGVYSDLPSGVVLVSDEQEGLFVLDVSALTGCLTDAQCDDNNPCTTDTCGTGGSCVTTPKAPGTVCDDSNTCTTTGQCDAQGTCITTDINTIPCVNDTVCGPGRCDQGAGFCVCFECVIVDRPTAPQPVVATNRFLTITPAAAPTPTALRVTLSSPPAQFAASQGLQMWVGEPFQMTEQAGATDATLPTITVAPLVCSPVEKDWATVGTIHVFGDAVVPGALYDVQATGIGCVNAGIPRFSPALPLPTSQWGDSVGRCNVIPCTPPDGSVDIIFDCVAGLDKFRNSVGAASKVREDLGPNVPDFIVDIEDITRCVDAFAGRPYSFAGPSGCP